MSITILGIESSCDETSAAICQNGKVINNVIAAQSIHQEYGGVVPELASRAHQKNIVPVVDSALKNAQVTLKDLDAIAYTQGPGLLGALLIGASFAKSMAYALDVPLLPINHMRAHILAHFINDPTPEFPFLCLTVSGGHTQIVRVDDHHTMNIIGQTRDDAVGEAFDKGAKLLGLSYPGGPLVDYHAQKGDSSRFQFAKSEIPDLDYSFSGIKTSLLYFLQKEVQNNNNFIEENLDDLCAGYQDTLIEMLMNKLLLATRREHINRVAIAGGVSANKGLRTRLKTLSEKHGWEIFIPKFEYCTDNAAMIAISGHFKFLNHERGSLRDGPLPRMTF